MSLLVERCLKMPLEMLSLKDMHMWGALRLKLPAQMTAVFSEETNHSFSVDLSFTVPEF